MIDLTPTYLPRILQHKITDINLSPGHVAPVYSGWSLLNIPGGIQQLLGLPAGANPAPGLPAMAPEIISAEVEPAQGVIMLVLDGLGLYAFQDSLSQGLGKIWQDLPGKLYPLTSVCPSTTTAALSTLWTGTPPAAHGLAGYELWLAEYGVVANMVYLSPTTFANDPGGLSRSTFRPETFLPVEGLGPRLQAQDVKVFAFMHHTLARSGLSAMHLKQAAVIPFSTPSDLAVKLRDLVDSKSRTGEKYYAYIYWGALDEFGHVYGPSDERIGLEFDAFSRSIGSAVHKIAEQRHGALRFILTADHGMLSTPKRSVYDLRTQPEFYKNVYIQPTGESRCIFLHARPGREQALAQYFEEHWPGDFRLFPSELLVERGLFGDFPHHPQLLDRLGTWIAIANGTAYLWWAAKENRLLGRHGGLLPEEMLVPFYLLNL
jgi:hypothetical protein